MGKACVVKNCLSGRKSVNNIKDMQDLSFFQPRTPAKTENWSKCLGIDLKATDKICQLHFKQEDVKIYEKLYINGEVKLFPLRNKRLNKDASPTINHQFVSLHEHQSVIELQQVPNIYELSKQEEQQKIKRSKNTVKLKSLDQQTADKVTDGNDRNKQTPQKPRLIKKTEKKIKEHQKPQIIDIHSIEYIKDNINQLPPFWLYVEDSNKLEFMRLDPSNGQIKNHIRINNDLTITVIFQNNEETIFQKKINAFPTVYEFLKLVEKWPFCDGTDILNHRYSKNCKGVLIIAESYKKKLKYIICKSCRIYRRQLQERNSTNGSKKKANCSFIIYDS